MMENYAWQILYFGRQKSCMAHYFIVVVLVLMTDRHCLGLSEVNLVFNFYLFAFFFFLIQTYNKYFNCKGENS